MNMLNIFQKVKNFLSLIQLILHDLKLLRVQRISVFQFFVLYLNLLLPLSLFTKQETQAVVMITLTKNFVDFSVHIKYTTH